MANEYVWISVQSDFGLTMAELGRLSSSTDPKLIASTLMALKDIVSKEATESDSQFMSGKIETAQYGNFTIAASDQTKLVMTYIISTDKNRTVDQKFVTLIEDLIRNFGKQLTQFGEISDLVNSGAVLPRSILIQAYLNACTIVRTERKLDTRDRHLKESYRETINDVIKNNETMILFSIT